MRMLMRKPVNKRKSASNFKKTARKTKSMNMAKAPNRGGWRL